ncbi:unnamed protein product [Callosobruchus maculatus]|uniref:SOCS box domain-containing protein n=1 Tax=Callosobruchus maculatus TaxID=64391 RepID=A0A653CGU2_CALMS|nr:unnamed protein product [Callosobruchus maculatus]
MISILQLSDPTVGVDFFARLIEVKDGTRIKLQLWDTAGQERFRSITKSYYRNSVGALLVYDICNRSSFEHIPQWMTEARRHIEPHRPVFALVGCKLDLVANGGQREVSKEEAKHFAGIFDYKSICEVISFFVIVPNLHNCKTHSISCSHIIYC